MDNLTATNIAAWLACLAFIVVLINGGFKLARNVKGQEPHPPNSNLGQSIAEHGRRLDNHDREITSLRDDMKEDRDKNEIHASQRSSTIHKKIDDVRKELSDKIDDMPAQVITILRNTGALRK